MEYSENISAVFLRISAVLEARPLSGEGGTDGEMSRAEHRSHEVPGRNSNPQNTGSFPFDITKHYLAHIMGDLPPNRVY
jgi:hypothetical protein